LSFGFFGVKSIPRIELSEDFSGLWKNIHGLTGNSS